MLHALFEIVAAVLVTATVVAVVVAIVSWDEIKSWFQSYKSKINNTDIVARTIVEKLNNGHYTVKQGVFNKRTAVFEAEKVVESKDIDAELKRRHAGQRIVDHYV